MTSSTLWSLYVAIVAIVVVAIIWFYVASRHKTRCPRCGSTSIQATPKKWVTSPQVGMYKTPVLATLYKYKCLKCQNEWEEY